MVSTSADSSASTSIARGQLTFSIARSRDELTQAFRLVFEAYYRAGLVTEKPSRIRLTPYHLMPTSEVLVAKLGDTVTSTMSMFGDGYLGLPMESMYAQQVSELRKRNLRLAEIGCLADRRRSPVRFMQAFMQLSRLVAQTCRVRGIDAVLAVMHPKHAKLYERRLGFERIGELTKCPYANDKPAVALYLNFAELQGTRFHEMYYRDPWPQKDLAPYHWDKETRKHFRKILEVDNSIASAAGIQGYYNWAAVTGHLTTQ